MFSKSHRVHSNEFEEYFRSGKRSHGETCYLAHSPLNEVLKVSVVVPKKIVRSAVQRNRIRRQLYHLLKPLLAGKTGVFIIVIKKVVNGKMSPTTPQELQDLIGRTQ